MKFIITIAFVLAVIPNIYSQNSSADDNKNFKWIYKHSAGEDSDNSFAEGLASVSKDGKWGYINKKGEWVIQPVFSAALSFSNGKAIVQKNEKWGIIDPKGNWLLKPDKYAMLDDLGNGYFKGFDWDTNPKTSELLDSHLNKVLSSTKYNFSYVGNKTIGVSLQNDNRLMGLINFNGNIVLPLKYEFVCPYDDGTRLITENRKHFLTNSSGKKLFQTTYDGATFTEGLAPYKDSVSGKQGFADKNGKIIIPAKYDWVYQFSGGLALVQKEKKWGVIDKKGKIILSPRFEDEYIDLIDNMVLFTKDGKVGFANLKGEIVVPPQYRSASGFKNGFALVSTADNKNFIINMKGRKIQIPGEYSENDVLNFDGYYINSTQGILELLWKGN